MKLSEKLRIRNLGERTLAAFRRFPLTAGFAAGLTVFAMALVHHGGTMVSESFSIAALWYLAAAAVLSLSLALWREEKPKGAAAVQAGLHLMLLGTALYFAFRDSLGLSDGIAIGAVSAALAVSVFLVSFFRDGNDIPLWNFTLRTAAGLAASGLVTAILWGGILLLLTSFKELFGIRLPDEPYADLSILCWALLAPVLFLQLVPGGDRKHDSSRLLRRFGKKVICYLFIPLQLTYLLVLYVYASKILFTWTLPAGWVSYLVSASMLGMLLLVTLLYPERFSEEETPFERAVAKWLPAAMLPLLLLMTVGICRRFLDYGITVARLYLLVFNLWCYAVCIALLVTQGRRIGWIPASFAAVFLLISFGPQNLSGFTRRSLQRQVKTGLTKGGAETFPVDSARYAALLAAMPPDEAARIESKLAYLHSAYPGRTALASLVDSTVQAGTRGMADMSFSERNFYSDNGNLQEGATTIPEGFSKVYFIDSDTLRFSSPARDTVVFVAVCPEDHGAARTYEFPLPLADLRQIQQSEARTVLQLVCEDSILSVKNFHLSFSPSPDGSDENVYSSFSGLLFLK